jgi:hypothetical protein
MKTKLLVLLALLVVFIAALAYVLLREVTREEATLAQSISGVVDLDGKLAASGAADVVRTDRLVLMLVDPQTQRPVALRFVTPLVPPQTIRIGQADAREAGELKGPYLVVAITDKDGEIFKVTPGEVYGRTPAPVALGTEKLQLVLNEPFRGSLFNEAGAAAPGMEGLSGSMPGMAMGGPNPPAAGSAPGGSSGAGPMGPAGEGDADPRYSIAGTITVSKALAAGVAPSDRLVILLFDPQQDRPVSFKIIPHTLLPQRFTITLPPDARATAKQAYSLRILTDKNNDPFGAAPGEVIGRSSQPIPLGTADVNFVLDQPYTR